MDDQLKLVDEAEFEARIPELEEQAEQPATSRPNKPASDVPKDKPLRRPLPEHIPLYRQEKIFAREGIDISRQSIAGWMIGLDGKLTPLMAEITRILYEGRVIHINESRRLQVLKELGCEASQQFLRWVYRGGPLGQQIVWFQYAQTRSGGAPREFFFPTGQWAADGDPPPAGCTSSQTATAVTTP